MASQFQIEILTVTGPTKSTKGKNTWSILEIAYKKDGKIEGKKLVDFNNQEVFKALTGAKQGEKYEITSEKQGEYWVWTSATKEGEASPQVSEDAAETSVLPSKESEVSTGSRPASRVTGSNYETPEERAKRRTFEWIKHRQISKQATLNTAIAILSTGDQAVTLEQVITLSNKLQQYVTEQSYQEAVEGLKNIPDDVPF